MADASAQDVHAEARPIALSLPEQRYRTGPTPELTDEFPLVARMGNRRSNSRPPSFVDSLDYLASDRRSSHRNRIRNWLVLSATRLDDRR